MLLPACQVTYRGGYAAVREARGWTPLADAVSDALGVPVKASHIRAVYEAYLLDFEALVFGRRAASKRGRRGHDSDSGGEDENGGENGGAGSPPARRGRLGDSDGEEDQGRREEEEDEEEDGYGDGDA